MKQVLVKSVFDAFEYVMGHFYPNGQEERAQRTDTYAVISIQDTHTNGFGFEFNESQFCKGVLTLYFDDIVKEINGAKLFDDEQANQIIDFIQTHKKYVDILLVHCYGGQSRSRAGKMLGGDNSKYFETATPNEYIYDVLETAWIQRMLCGKFI